MTRLRATLLRFSSGAGPAVSGVRLFWGLAAAAALLRFALAAGFDLSPGERRLIALATLPPAAILRESAEAPGAPGAPLFQRAWMMVLAPLGTAGAEPLLLRLPWVLAGFGAALAGAALAGRLGGPRARLPALLVLAFAPAAAECGVRIGPLGPAALGVLVSTLALFSILERLDSIPPGAKGRPPGIRLRMAMYAAGMALAAACHPLAGWFALLHAAIFAFEAAAVSLEPGRTARAGLDLALHQPWLPFMIYNWGGRAVSPSPAGGFLAPVRRAFLELPLGLEAGEDAPLYSGWIFAAAAILAIGLAAAAARAIWSSARPESTPAPGGEFPDGSPGASSGANGEWRIRFHYYAAFLAAGPVLLPLFSGRAGAAGFHIAERGGAIPLMPALALFAAWAVRPRTGWTALAAALPPLFFLPGFLAMTKPPADPWPESAAGPAAVRPKPGETLRGTDPALGRWIRRTRGARMERLDAPAKDATVLLLHDPAAEAVRRERFLWSPLLLEVLNVSGAAGTPWTGPAGERVWRVPAGAFEKILDEARSARASRLALSDSIAGGLYLWPGDGVLSLAAGWSEPGFTGGFAPCVWSLGESQVLDWRGPSRPGTYRLLVRFFRPAPYPEKDQTIEYFPPGATGWRTAEAPPGAVELTAETGVDHPGAWMHLETRIPSWIPAAHVPGSTDARRLGVLLLAVEMTPLENADPAEDQEDAGDKEETASR